MPTTLEQLQYGFDRDSRRTWRQRATTQGWDNAYVYDSLSQVIGDDRGDLNLAHNAIAGIPSNGSRWQYDETGNWHDYETQVDGAATLNQARTHDKGNRLMEVSGAAVMRTDRAGRMLETVPGPGNDWNSSYQITWDAWSRIVGVASVVAGTTAPVAAYAYDGLARRITRYTNAGDVTLHSYYNDEWRPVEERKDSATTAAASYLWGSRHRDDLVRRDRAVGGTTLNETRCILMDYFSPASITDEAGAVTERYQFSAFGLRTILNSDYTVRSVSECSMEFGFQGQFEDAETGWMNYGYRYYLAALGRWACKDPLGQNGGLNLYAASNNNVVGKVDFLGLVSVDFTPADEDPGTRLVSKTQTGNPMETAYDGDSWCECDDKCKLTCYAFIDATIYQDEDWSYPFMRLVRNGEIPISDASKVYGHEQAHIRARNEEVEHKINQAVKGIPTDHQSKTDCESDRTKAEQAMENIIGRLRNGNLSPSHPYEKQKPGMDPLWPGKNRPPFDGIPMNPV